MITLPKKEKSAKLKKKTKNEKKKKTSRIEKAWEKTRNPEMKKTSMFPSSKDISVHWKSIKETVTNKGGERIHDYLYNSTINCYSYLGDRTLRWEEKLIWWCVHLCATAVAGYVVWVAADKTTPSVTSRNPDGISVTQVDFPGLGICPLNRLSRRKVGILARNLENNKYNETDLLNILGYLGLAYSFEDSPSDELDTIHSLLDTYDLETVIKNLAPDCGEMLVRCMWHNKIVDCSSIFKLHKTSEGFCCTFNYLRTSDNSFRNIDQTTIKKLTSTAGQDRGLSVVLNPRLEDYLYTMMPNLGFKLMIFNPSDFPDKPSGGCLEQTVSPRMEQYISLDATVIEASEAVQALPKSERGCMVDADKESMYASYGDCIVSCRIKSAKNSCGCIPFFLPSASLAKFCDLTDNGCLRKWKKTWEDAWSGEDQTLESSDSVSQAEKGPPCSYCVPSCSDTSYSSHRYSVSLQPGSVNRQPDSDKAPLKKGIIFKDHCVLHVFFDKDSFILLNHDILLSWYDWMSSLGGLCGLVIGCSMLSLVEIIYFFVFGGPAKGTQKVQIPARELYWQELRR